MPNKLTLTQMAAEVRSGRLSSVELVEAHLHQIERLNPVLNAFVSVFAEEARAAAKAAEGQRERGRLGGVPVTIKDCFDVQGQPTLCGSRLRLGHRAGQDATAVARLRAAGAIVLGKTNCPESLYNYETDNYITGRTNSPWDLERTPGGSSGGEAAASASFCSPGGLGSDGGGSIREPAHFSGIAGLKPTPGRVSAAGHFPAISHPGGLLGVGGPMARTAEDVRLLFEVTAGYDTEDPFSAPVPLRQPDLGGLRIGLMPQFYDVPVQPAIRAALDKAARVAEQLGFPVEPFRPRGLQRATELWWFFFGRVPAPFLRRMFAGHEQEAHWTGTELMSLALEEPEPTAREIIENLAARDAMRSALLREMREFPVLLAPACGVVAFRHRERRWLIGERWIGLLEAMAPLTPVNLLGLPAMVIPFDLTADGLPVGIQLIGRPYDEELLLELAVRLEEARGPFPAPPLAR
jgi:Asp-tRNA(Asn)/Glu-tRNA(Gln) amidotransferase A subunit family amidase